MNRSERFYKIDQLLTDRKVVTRLELLDELEISWATLKRDLAFLKDRFNAPIIHDRDTGGYRFAEPGVGPSYELPGLWFSADETYALLTMHRLLSDLEPRLLAPHVAPLLSRLENILGQEGQRFDEIAQRIHLARIGHRFKDAEHFSELSRALLQRQQVRITHYSRERDEHTARTVSPQRLTFYRNNWYLEAWCHEREALRRFSVDAIESVQELEARATEVAPEALEAAFSSSYGIYGGSVVHRAELRFSPRAARWVAREEWHPNQIGTFDSEGHYRLTIPYADPTELVMDILRHGHHVEVLAPEALRVQVRDEIARMARHYSTSHTAHAPVGAGHQIHDGGLTTRQGLPAEETLAALTEEKPV